MYWREGGPQTHMTGLLVRRGRDERREGHVAMEAETGVMCLEALGRPGLPATLNLGEGSEHTDPTIFRGNKARPDNTSIMEPSSPELSEYRCVVLTAPGCRTSLAQPQGTKA